MGGKRTLDRQLWQGWKLGRTRDTAHRLKQLGLTVPKYHPINVGCDLDRMPTDLTKIHWEVNAFTAEFELDENRSVRVEFDQQCIVRILDEMALSTEDDPSDVKGLVPNHFAYRVEGSTFAATQSGAWKELSGSVSHYQFVTDWGCVDVLSGSQPRFEVVNSGG